MRMLRICAGLAAASVAVLGMSTVAGATHSAGSSGAPPQDFSAGSFKGSSGSVGSLHARYTAHLPAVQSSGASFEGHGEAVIDVQPPSHRARGDLLCGSVEGNDAFLLYLLREPLQTQSGPVRHFAIFAFDHGQPSETPSDQVAFAFIQYIGAPPEESRNCSMVGFVFERTHGNVMVHDSAG